MSLTRQTQKVFGSNANANQLAVFGSMKTGTPVYSTNLATLQSTAYTQGWSEALLSDKAPYMEEMNAVQYGFSYQIAYMLQEGAFAYDANTTYSSTSIVKSFEDGKMYFYHSLIDNNTGHSLSDPTYWEKISFASQSDLNNKADIDLSNINPTQTAINTIVGWGMPDYTGGISVSSSSYPYTAPSNGYFYATYYATGGGQYTCSITINNQTFAMQTQGGRDFAFMPVSAGDVISVSGSGDPSAGFFPIKGGN